MASLIRAARPFTISLMCCDSSPRSIASKPRSHDDGRSQNGDSKKQSNLIRRQMQRPNIISAVAGAALIAEAENSKFRQILDRCS